MSTRTVTTFICDNCGVEEHAPSGNDVPPEMPKSWVILWSWDVPRKLVCGPKCGIAYMLEAIETSTPVMQLSKPVTVTTDVGDVEHVPVTEQFVNSPVEEQGHGGH